MTQEPEDRREYADGTGDAARRRWSGRAARAIGLLAGVVVACEAGAQTLERGGLDTVPGRAAAELQLCVVDRPRYAAEPFGPGADAVELGYGREADDAGLGHPPKVLLRVPDRGGQSGDDLAEGSSARVAFTLHGAVFAERARQSDVSLGNVAEATADACA